MIQLHQLGIEGIRPWKTFFETIEKQYGHSDCPAEYHLFGANVPQKIDPNRHKLRDGFFSALIRDGITVHKGFSVLDHKKRLVEKGVDVLLSLELVDLSANGYDEIFLFSADGDIVPAIQRAQKNGAVVKAILNFDVPAGYIAETVDDIIRLDDVINFIPSKHLPRRDNKKPKTFKESGVA